MVLSFVKGLNIMASNQTNTEELLQLAIRAAKDGQRDGARMMLQQVLQRSPKNETAMMWMARMANTKKERIHWLERVLEYNPDNAAAQKALHKIQYAQQAANNRTLMLFGAVAVVLFVLIVVALLIVLT